MQTSLVCLLSEAYPELKNHWELPGTILDCRDIPGTTCYCDAEAQALLRRRLEGCGPAFIRWIDTGDYHYLSRLNAPHEPYSLILLDHHPDMQPAAFGPVLSCGGWVRTLLEDDPLLDDVLLIGIDPALEEETAGFPDRVRVVTEDRFHEAFSLRMHKPVFLSMDKDVLRLEDARTDWDQGSMSLEGLLHILEGIFAENRVLCADVCGERPESRGGTPQDRAVNAATNAVLQKALLRLANL